MPVAVLKHLYVHTPARERHSILLFSGAGVLLGAAVWSLAAGAQAGGSSGVVPLYPPAAPVIRLISVPDLTVMQVVRKLPITSRFDILLDNTGVRDDLMDKGPYTLFAPADNYFDYLPKGAYVSLTRLQERELAEHMVVPDIAIGTGESDSGQYVTMAQDTIPVQVRQGSVFAGDSFAIEAYRASNGIVYVINKIVAPNDLTARLAS